MTLKNLYCVLLVALMGTPGLGTNVQNYSTADQWNITIIGPDTVFVGSMSQFTCLVNCAECSFSWVFQGGFPPALSLSIYKNVINWVPSIPNIVQNFTCVAQNTFGNSTQATKTVHVKDYVTDSPSSGSEVVQLCLCTLIFNVGLLVLFDL